MMVASTDLHFDKMEVDCKLAQEYMSRYPIFNSIGFTTASPNQYMFDAAKNKICYLEKVERNALQTSDEPREKLDYLDNWIKLAVEIEKNTNLFCQLEFLIRNKSIEASKLELRMVIKHLHYMASIHVPFIHNGVILKRETLAMKDVRPIIDLGFLAHLGPAVDIVASANTAVVCHLFTELCNNSGFDLVSVAFIKDNEKIFGVLDDAKSEVLAGGCVGVVTTQSDVDSAVDAFLSAPTGVLWGIRRILVQESASERLKSALAWKTRSESQADVDLQLKSLCTDIYVHDGKTFLLEYVGGDRNLRNVVLIESFRTVKELLTMIESEPPFCVSLWSSVVTESNEIAFGITAPMVWVNDYGYLGEPHMVSLAYYSQLGPSNINDSLIVDQVHELQKDWAKFTDDERTCQVKRILAKNKDDRLNFSLKQDLRNVQALRTTVHVSAGDMVFAVPRQHDVYFIKLDGNMWYFAEMFKRLLSGSGLIISSSTDFKNLMETFITQLEKDGLPIRLLKHVPVNEAKYKTFLLPEPTRIIHTNFGTIFAN